LIKGIFHKFLSSTDDSKSQNQQAFLFQHIRLKYTGIYLFEAFTPKRPQNQGLLHWPTAWLISLVELQNCFFIEAFVLDSKVFQQKGTVHIRADMCNTDWLLRIKNSKVG
jgi:hypothetical protein